MVGIILKATKSSFQKGMTCCRSIYVKKVMKLLAFIFEQPSYWYNKLHLRYYDLICKFQLDLNRSCSEDFRNLSYRVTWCTCIN